MTVPGHLNLTKCTRGLPRMIKYIIIKKQVFTIIKKEVFTQAALEHNSMATHKCTGCLKETIQGVTAADANLVLPYSICTAAGIILYYLCIFLSLSIIYPSIYLFIFIYLIHAILSAGVAQVQAVLVNVSGNRKPRWDSINSILDAKAPNLEKK